MRTFKTISSVMNNNPKAPLQQQMLFHINTPLCLCEKSRRAAATMQHWVARLGKDKFVTPELWFCPELSGFKYALAVMSTDE